MLLAGIALGLAVMPTTHGDTLSLALDQATGMALENNHELAAASYQVAEAQSAVKIARTGFLPKLKARASYTRLDEEPYLNATGFSRLFEPLMAPFEDLVANGYLDPSTLSGLSGAAGPGRIVIGDDDNYSINMSVEQPLFTGFQLLNNLKISKYRKRNSELMLRRTEESVWLKVSEGYWGLYSALEAVAVTEESIIQLESHVADLRHLLAAGMIIENDLLRAELALSNARLQKVRATNGVNLANAALCNVLAIDQDHAIVPTDKPVISSHSFPDLDSLSLSALARRPDYQAMANNLEILEKLKAIKRADYFPKLALVANHDWKRPNREYEPEFYTSWNVNLIATLDVFSWGRRHYEIQKAEAQRRQTAEQRRQLADFIQLQVRSSYLMVQEAKQAAEIAALAVSQAQENYRVTSTNYRAGALTNSDLLDAQRALTQAKLASVTAITTHEIAVASLRVAISDIEVQDND